MRGVATAPGPRVVRLGLRENLAQFSLLVAVNALVGGMVGQERTVLPLLARQTFALWGILPLLFAADGQSLEAIGVLAALYPGVWCVAQLFTGAWSDRVGRKPLIVAGMVLQGVALLLVAATTGFTPWAVGAVLIGIGTALVYPTLIAAVGDQAHPTWRATAVGVYRLWRDTGYVVGALMGGAVADLFGLRAAVVAVAALSLLSGLFVVTRMKETAPSLAERTRM